MKDLSVIIINYNAKEQVKECVRSLIKYTEGIEYEVIVVDNCSTEQGVEQTLLEFPRIQFIQNRENAGFAKANNKAAMEATGRNLLFLNPDTILFDNALGDLVHFIDSRNVAGIVGPKLYRNLKREYHPLYAKFTSPFKIFTWHLPLHHALSRFYHTYICNSKIIRSVDWVCGAALMIKKDLWVELQGFDEKYFMYCEDQDLCLRAKQKGYEVFYYPKAEIVHLGGHSADQTSEKSFRYYWESKIYFLKRYSSEREIKWFKVYFRWLIYLKILLKIKASYYTMVLEILEKM
jgi:N-acetylglucosaminyl-diphospho-decaprenol L-rhamnosyltransferase